MAPAFVLRSHLEGPSDKCSLEVSRSHFYFYSKMQHVLTEAQFVVKLANQLRISPWLKVSVAGLVPVSAAAWHPSATV